MGSKRRTARGYFEFHSAGGKKTHALRVPVALKEDQARVSAMRLRASVDNVALLTGLART